ncbi:hypothetical protein CC1G_10579 [Coprinopsis cinerea okayama7|uniref:Uncharacterized protein n=1 Tax=Coprinopsis cinerea (strain Okayama-7 / 130 / ATCC MYA-4618 / FGSC 9003) TaxID=240176 RepID=A8NDZ3_COPC7|nr:hypothetical protein CC1G_10579 [Coprinopsis cinerea okayama7\|eukprot:XP_001832903.1 hypothetical protein CC1G_10579 [Coprinopsis cinerea okayama7\
MAGSHYPPLPQGHPCLLPTESVFDASRAPIGGGRDVVQSLPQVSSRLIAGDDHSAMRGVPNEIIALFLRFALETAKQDRRRQGHHFAETDPFLLNTLRLVCTSWNDIALSTPQLWRGLELNLDLWKPNHFSANLAHFADTWFNRAGERAPLRLHIVGQGTPVLRKFESSNWASFSGQLLHILMGTDRNWVEWHFDSAPLHRACLRKGGLEYAWGFLGLGDVVPPWTNLKSLSLDLSDDDRGPLHVRGYGLFWTPESLPALESLHVRSKPTTPVTLDTFPPHLRSLHLTDCLDLLPCALSNLPLLEELVVESTDPDAAVPAFGLLSEDGLEPRALERLVFIGRGAAASLVDAVPSHFTFPFLKVLQLAGVSSGNAERELDGSLLGAALSRLLEKCESPEVTVSLEDSGLSSGAMHALLDSLHSGSDDRSSCGVHLRLDCPVPYPTFYHTEEQRQSPSFPIKSVALRCAARHADLLSFLEGRIFHIPTGMDSHHTKVFVPRLPELQRQGVAGSYQGLDIEHLNSVSLDALFTYDIFGHQYHLALDSFALSKDNVSPSSSDTASITV